jgi:hypothetical protein
MMALAFLLPSDLSSAGTDADAWFASLPAKVRADLTWAPRPIFEALRPLLDGPLEREAVEATCRAALTVYWGNPGVRAMMRAVFVGPFPFAGLRQAFLDELAEIVSFLASPAGARHATMATRVQCALVTFMESVLRDVGPAEREAMAQAFEATSTDDLVRGALSPGWGDISYSAVLLMAVMYARHEGGRERGRELVRRSLAYLVRGAGTLRKEGGFIDVDPGEPDSTRDDEILDALATLAFGQREGAVERLGLVDPKPEPARFGLRRVIGHVRRVDFSPRTTVVLGDEKETVLVQATPELVERAFALRAERVQALIAGGEEPRLVRLDPAGAPVGADDATRAAAMLHDWDELLERLAR